MFDDDTVESTRWLYRGWIDQATPAYDPVLHDVVTVNCIDAFGEAGQSVAPTGPEQGVNETVTARVNRVLDAVGWFPAKRKVATVVDDGAGHPARLEGGRLDDRRRRLGGWGRVRRPRRRRRPQRHRLDVVRPGRSAGRGDRQHGPRRPRTRGRPRLRRPGPKAPSTNRIRRRWNGHRSSSSVSSRPTTTRPARSSNKAIRGGSTPPAATCSTNHPGGCGTWVPTPVKAAPRCTRPATTPTRNHRRSSTNAPARARRPTRALPARASRRMTRIPRRRRAALLGSTSAPGCGSTRTARRSTPRVGVTPAVRRSTSSGTSSQG